MGGKGDLKTIKMDPGILRIVQDTQKWVLTHMYFSNYIFLI